MYALVTTKNMPPIGFQDVSLCLWMVSLFITLNKFFLVPKLPLQVFVGTIYPKNEIGNKPLFVKTLYFWVSPEIRLLTLFVFSQKHHYNA